MSKMYLFCDRDIRPDGWGLTLSNMPPVQLQSGSLVSADRTWLKSSEIEPWAAKPKEEPECLALSLDTDNMILGICGLSHSSLSQALLDGKEYLILNISVAGVKKVERVEVKKEKDTRYKVYEVFVECGYSHRVDNNVRIYRVVASSVESAKRVVMSTDGKVVHITAKYLHDVQDGTILSTTHLS